MKQQASLWASRRCAYKSRREGESRGYWWHESNRSQVCADGKLAKRRAILITDVSRWNNRTHGYMTFYLSKVLSGLGIFNYYRLRLNIVGSDICARCEAMPDVAEHAIIICDAWHNWRRGACGNIGIQGLMPDNLMETMMVSRTYLYMLASLISRIMRTRVEEVQNQHRGPLPKT